MGPLAFLLAAALPVSAASRLEIDCDARADVLGVVQTLAGWRREAPRLPRSMEDLPRRFAAFKDHPVVASYARTAERLDGHEPYGLILSALSAPPEFAWTRPRRDMSVDFVEKAGGPEALERFLRDLRDFSRRSGVDVWLASRAGECRAAQREATRELAGRRPLDELEAYLGRSLDARVRVALSLVYTPYRYSACIHPYPYAGEGPLPRGPFQVFALLEPRWDETGRPNFGLERPFANEVFNEPYYIAAEPAYRRHRERFDARAGLAADFGADCASNWQNCAMAIVVRALNVRLARQHGEGAPPLPRETAEVVGRLAQRLEREYEPGRAVGRYRSIDDFWPRLIDALGSDSPTAKSGPASSRPSD